MIYSPEGVINGYRMVRNPNPAAGEGQTKFIGDKPTYNNDDFIAGPVKKGKYSYRYCSVLNTYPLFTVLFESVCGSIESGKTIQLTRYLYYDW